MAKKEKPVEDYKFVDELAAPEKPKEDVKDCSAGCHKQLPKDKRREIYAANQDKTSIYVAAVEKSCLSKVQNLISEQMPHRVDT